MRVTTLALFFFIFALITLSWGMTRADDTRPESRISRSAGQPECGSGEPRSGIRHGQRSSVMSPANRATGDGANPVSAGPVACAG